MIASNTAQGKAAMAKRRDPSSSGPNAVNPARIAGKAEAQPITVTARARMGTQSNFRGTGRASEPRDIKLSIYVAGKMEETELLDNRQDGWRAVSMNHITGFSQREQLLPLDTLRAFEAAARTGSFSSAAETLSVTHGAVSRQIAKLE